MEPSSAALLTLSALVVGIVGAVSLRDVAAGHGEAIWLAALAIVHLALGRVRARPLAVAPPMRRLLLVLGVILADVAIALTANGVVLTLVWGAVAVACACLSRRTLERPSDYILAEVALGAHIALGWCAQLSRLHPAACSATSPRLGSCLPSPLWPQAASPAATSPPPGRGGWAMRLNALGFAAIAYLTAQALSGPMLAAAWALEALALLGVSVSTHSQQARYAGAAFMTLSLGDVLILEAPPAALVTGAPDLLAAAKALGAIALALLAGSRVDREARWWLIAGGVVSLLYLVSIAIATAFQPAAGSADIALLDLKHPTRGPGSAERLLELGRGGRPDRRTADQQLGYPQRLARTAPGDGREGVPLRPIHPHVYLQGHLFIALGLLLLVGAFAYQRLRPPPLPDMRKVHRSQR